MKLTPEERELLKKISNSAWGTDIEFQGVGLRLQIGWDQSGDGSPAYCEIEQSYIETDHGWMPFCIPDDWIDDALELAQEQDASDNFCEPY